MFEGLCISVMYYLVFGSDFLLEANKLAELKTYETLFFCSVYIIPETLI